MRKRLFYLNIRKQSLGGIGSPIHSCFFSRVLRSRKDSSEAGTAHNKLLSEVNWPLINYSGIF